MADQKTVVIVCKGKRLGGTKIDLYGKNYHFRAENPADPDAQHVCAIPFDDARQIHRLLSIKDHYALQDPDAEIPAKPAPEKGQTIAGEQGKLEEKPIIIKNGDGDEINLTEKDREELAQLAKELFSIKVHHKWDRQTLIAKIIEATRAGDE